MKLPCKIIEDLLPLYEEGICSEETREAIEQHLNECERCKNLYKGMQEIPMIKFESQKSVQDKAMKKGLKKIKKHWWVSIIIAIMIVPLSILGWNQYNERGICFTNLNELRIANAFVKHLNQGDYAGAFKYIDLDDVKLGMVQLGTKKLKKFEDRAPVIFEESAQDLIEVGGISDYKYEWVRHRISSSGVSYDVQFRVKAGERWYTLTVVTNDKGVEWFSCGESFKTDPLAYFDCWTHWLWQDLEGCYLDFETNEYVYY